MDNKLKIILEGKDRQGEDSLCVEDFLAQISSFVNILKQVENQISAEKKVISPNKTDDTGNEITWKITNLTKNSPMTIEVTPFPSEYGTDIQEIASKTVETTLDGFRNIANRNGLPNYFTSETINKVSEMCKSIVNGLAKTTVDVGANDNIENLELTPQVASKTIIEIDNIHAHSSIPTFEASQPYKEFGSVEGYIFKVQSDKKNIRSIWIRSRITGQEIKCILKEKGFNEILGIGITDVWDGMRVSVNGVVNYKSKENISSIEVKKIHIYEADKNLPSINDIVLPNFTDGVEAVEYLEALRKNE